MGVTITWAPSTELDIESYDIEISATLTTPSWALLVNILHNTGGANYSEDDEVFFYTHVAATGTAYYRLVAIDLVGNRSDPSTPFQSTALIAPITNLVAVDHDYPTTNNLRYQDADGVPIVDAVIRVFTKAAFDLGDTEVALATTRTDEYGEWASPIYLTTGLTYTIYFAKEGVAGPNTAEIVV